jgi:hypothetical protein
LEEYLVEMKNYFYDFYQNVIIIGNKQTQKTLLLIISDDLTTKKEDRQKDFYNYQFLHKTRKLPILRISYLKFMIQQEKEKTLNTINQKLTKYNNLFIDY